jgi:hypothetical protein
MECCDTVRPSLEVDFKMTVNLAPGTAPFVVDGSVQFTIAIDGSFYRCTVEDDVLCYHFGDTYRSGNRLAAFERGRDRILAVAATMTWRGPLIQLQRQDF